MKTYRLILFGLMVLASSCRKEQVNNYVINDQHVYSGSANKTREKTDLQLVSIAYADLFGKQISASELNLLITGYNSIGDKGLIIDRIIRKMLAVPGVEKPTAQEMRQDIDAFTGETFAKFFVRQPTEMEVWYFNKLITENPDLNPEDIYYVLMSSEEYRYY